MNSGINEVQQKTKQKERQKAELKQSFFCVSAPLNKTFSLNLTYLCTYIYLNINIYFSAENTERMLRFGNVSSQTAGGVKALGPLKVYRASIVWTAAGNRG